MSGFRVQLDALEQASQGVDGLLQNVRSAGLSNLRAGADVIGDDRLAESVGAFLQRWDVGVGALAEDGRAIAERLRRSADAYRRIEEKIGDGFVQGAGADPAAH